MKRLSIIKVFLATHPRKGEPTQFVEKIFSCMFNEHTSFNPTFVFDIGNTKQFMPKHHTFRGYGKHKAGDVVQLFYWDGKPYRSKQVVFAHVELKQVLKWNLDFGDKYTPMTLEISKVGSSDPLDSDVYEIYDEDTPNVDFTEQFKHIALNDGFSNPQDLLDWLCTDKTKKAGETIGGHLLIWGNVNYL
jgi:hypothetical protein